MIRCNSRTDCKMIPCPCCAAPCDDESIEAMFDYLGLLDLCLFLKVFRDAGQLVYYRI